MRTPYRLAALVLLTGLCAPLSQADDKTSDRGPEWYHARAEEIIQAKDRVLQIPSECSQEVKTGIFGALSTACVDRKTTEITSLLAQAQLLYPGIQKSVRALGDDCPLEPKNPAPAPYSSYRCVSDRAALAYRALSTHLGDVYDRARIADPKGRAELEAEARRLRKKLAEVEARLNKLSRDSRAKPTTVRNKVLSETAPEEAAVRPAPKSVSAPAKSP